MINRVVLVRNIYEKGVDEWCPRCDTETLLPYIEDATSPEDFKCGGCSEFLEPDAQKEEPYPPVVELMRGAEYKEG